MNLGRPGLESIFFLVCSLLVFHWAVGLLSRAEPLPGNGLDVSRFTGQRDFDFLPVSAEKAYARQVAAEVEREGQVVQDEFLSAYLEEIGRKLILRDRLRDPVGDWEWSFRIIDSAELDAFAALGGHVYLTRGLVEASESESELAAVLAFEIGHFLSGHVRQHILERLARLRDFSPQEKLIGEEGWQKLVRLFEAEGGVISFFSGKAHDSSQVEKADELALLRVHNARFNPQDFLVLLNRLERKKEPYPSWLKRNAWNQRRQRNISASLRMLSPLPFVEEDSRFFAFKARLISLSGRPEETSPLAEGEIVHQITVPGEVNWTDTGIEVKEGQDISFHAQGNVFLQQGNLVARCDPNGYDFRSMQQPLPDRNIGALIGKVAVLFSIEINKENGREFRYEVAEVFYIGSENTVAMPMSGRLYLGINENLVGDNSGAFTVNLAFRPPVLSP